MNGWKIDAILDEYASFAGTKARDLDKAYIEAFDSYAMSMRLNDIVYRLLSEQQHNLLTPPPSDKDVRDPSSAATQPENSTDTPLQTV